MNKTLIVVLIVALLCTSIASAGFFDWFTGKAAIAKQGKAFTGEQAGKSGIVPREQGKKVGIWEKIFGGEKETEKAAETRLSDLYPREATMSLGDFLNTAKDNRKAVLPFEDDTYNSMIEDCMENGFYDFSGDVATYVLPCMIAVPAGTATGAAVTASPGEECATEAKCEEYIGRLFEITVDCPSGYPANIVVTQSGEECSVTVTCSDGSSLTTTFVDSCSKLF